MEKYILIEVYGNINGDFEGREIYVFQFETIEDAKDALLKCHEGAYYHVFDEGEYSKDTDEDWCWIAEDGMTAYLDVGRTGYDWRIEKVTWN